MPSTSKCHPHSASSTSQCAVANPDVAGEGDALRLFQPPLQLVLLSNDTGFCSLTRSFLQHAGFTVFTCTTSDRAESLFLNRSDLQLWIIDVQALGIEAVYFATRVREQHPSMPIVLILDGHRDIRSLRHFLLHGWTQLTKPVDLAKMLATINDVMTTIPHGSATKRFHPDSSMPIGRVEPDWLKDFRWMNLSRTRN